MSIDEYRSRYCLRRGSVTWLLTSDRNRLSWARYACMFRRVGVASKGLYRVAYMVLRG
jgi:hypothetical protein